MPLTTLALADALYEVEACARTTVKRIQSVADVFADPVVDKAQAQMRRPMDPATVGTVISEDVTKLFSDA